MTTLERDKMQKQTTPIIKPRSSQAYQCAKKCAIPFEIINSSRIVWLGTYTKDTIPILARNLLTQITFIDTTIDCIEYINSLCISQRSMILIISDEYATDCKAIGHVLNLNQIKLIYIVLNNFQDTFINKLLNNTRIELIFNDTIVVLDQLTDEINKRSNHPDKQSPENIRPEQATRVEKVEKSATRVEKVEEPATTWKGFVTVGYQHFVGKTTSSPKRDEIGERTATVERFRDREPSAPDNYWSYRPGPFVYHWHPPGPSFRNVRRLR